MTQPPSLPLHIAVRFLREGRAQSLLILGGAGVGVAVLIFLSCLITSLQSSLVAQTLGSQAHIVVRPPEQTVAPVLSGAVLRSIEKPAQRLLPIEQWQRVVDDVAATAGVGATSPVVSGSGQAQRGLGQRAVTVRGIVPEAFDAIIDLQGRMREGDWRVVGDGCLVGTELAKELGLVSGDRLRVFVDEDHSVVVRVQGVFDLGAKDVNLRWVLVSLRQAQTLFDLDGGVSLIEVRVDDIFAASAVAADIAGRTGLTADSWMTLNAQLMVALQSQGSSSNMIQFFVVVAVALGISSVLVVSVVQKRKEVGILRAMGASRSQVMRVFLWQGAIVGVAGSLFGCVFGFGLLTLFKLAPLTFIIATPPALFLRACAIAMATGLLAAVVPARSAARLDPAVAIRSS